MSRFNLSDWQGSYFHNPHTDRSAAKKGFKTTHSFEDQKIRQETGASPVAMIGGMPTGSQPVEVPVES
jgi:hypothetical protein